MERFWEICKEHPLWVGGGVLFLVILFVFMGRSKSSSSAPSAGIYDITQDPNVVQANAAQAISQNQTNAAVTVAGLQQQVSLAEISAQQEVTDKQTAATTTLGTAQIAATQQTYANYFTAQTAQTQAMYGAAVSINQSNNATAESLANIQTQGQISMESLSANTVLALQGMQNNSAMDQLNANNLANTELAKLGLQSQKMGELGAIATQQLKNQNNAVTQYSNMIQSANQYNPGAYTADPGVVYGPASSTINQLLGL